MELCYHLILVRDATTAFAPEMVHADHDLDGPTLAHAVITTGQWVAGLSAV